MVEIVSTRSKATSKGAIEHAVIYRVTTERKRKNGSPLLRHVAAGQLIANPGV